MSTLKMSFQIYFFIIILNLVLHCHLAGILFYHSLTPLSLIFGGKTIHQKNPHQKSLKFPLLHFSISQSLVLPFCQWNWLFWTSRLVKWKYIFLISFRNRQIGRLWWYNKVLHSNGYQLPLTNFCYLNPWILPCGGHFA